MRFSAGHFLACPSRGFVGRHVRGGVVPLGKRSLVSASGRPAGQTSAAVVDSPGGAYYEDSLVPTSQQHPLEKTAALIVEEVFVPFVFHQLRNNHDDIARRMLLRKFQN